MRAVPHSFRKLRKRSIHEGGGGGGDGGGGDADGADGHGTMTTTSSSMTGRGSVGWVGP